MYFDLSLNEETDICLNFGITPTELFVLRLIFLANDGNSSYLTNFISNSNINLREILESLQNKKIINSSYKLPDKGTIFNPNNIQFNKVFIRSFIRNAHEIGKELFELYPTFININGKNCSIKNITKGGFYSLDDFFLHYAKVIKSSGTTHDKVIESLQFAIDNNLINYTLLEFIASQKWIEIDYIRNSGNINGYNNTELL
jgi:hypothetical protein